MLTYMIEISSSSSAAAAAALED